MNNNEKNDALHDTNKPYSPEVCAIIHKVKPGESLYQISRAYGIDYRRLMQLNNINDPRRLMTGQEICIPPMIDTSPDNQQTYTIQEGDTLYGISRKFGISLNSLMNENSDIDPYNMHIGMKLNIPNNTQQSVSTAPTQQTQTQILTGAPASNPSSVEQSLPVESSVPARQSGTVEPSIPVEMSVPATQPVSAGNSVSATPASMPDEINANHVDENRQQNNSSQHYVSDACLDGILYHVRKNDSLTDILSRFGICYAAIAAENPDIDFSQSIENITICVPYEDNYRNNSIDNTYTIRDGDNLSNIAGRVQKSTDELLMMNPYYNTDDFSSPGTSINIY